MTFIKAHPFEDLISSVFLANGKPTFPHHNIIRTKDGFIVQMALAGFSEDDLDIELKDGILNIMGRIEDRDPSIDYIHHGIATRSFHKTIQLGANIRVSGAELKNGILCIEMLQVIPDEKKSIKIPIGKVTKTSELLVE